ncbi:MAG: glycosyltransferase family 2 protein [bacterium]|nr:glycosyltransferase family 2 protein [bacterium]
MNFLCSLLYIYVTVFALYFVVYAIISALPAKKYRDKYTPKDSNICVVIYASGVVNTLENLLKQLKNQNYPQGNYTIYAILDKCENIPEVTLQGEFNVNVINIDNIEPIGKSQAYSIIAEKLHDVENLDAYVFLDAKNYVDSDFLMNVNFYLTKYQVFNPMIMYLPNQDDVNLWQKVRSVYSRYKYKFIMASRTALGLTNILNSDSFVITKNLLNKISVFDFRNAMSEVEYTYKLTKEGFKVALVSELKVYDSIEEFDLRIPSLSKRLNLFWSNIFKSQNYLSREFLFSLCSPNWLVFLIGLVLPAIYSRNFMASIGYSTTLITIAIFLLVFVVGLFNMKFYPKEYLYLFAYPALSIANLSYNLPICRWVRGLFNKTSHKPVIEKMTTDVIITDGTKDYPAKLELISDDGLARVTFINPNGKKYTTKNNHLRMIDAVRELSTKLNDYNMTLKVCQNCKYFQPLVDGSTNMVKGVCNCQFQGRTPGDIIPILIWNTCPNFEKNNVINLF